MDWTSGLPTSDFRTSDFDFNEYKEYMDEFDAVCWFGGSFAPPTIAHIDIAIAIGVRLYQLSGKQRCGVLITPVSPGYAKASVQSIERHHPGFRGVMIQEFLKLIYQRAHDIAEVREGKVVFRLETHELESPLPVPTYSSLLTIKTKYGLPADRVYIAQGQDNIETGIFTRQWVRSDLLLNHSFLIYLRGKSDNFKVALTTSNSNEKMAPLTQNDADIVLSRCHILSNETYAQFDDNISSSMARTIIHKITTCTATEEDLSRYMYPELIKMLHPLVVGCPYSTE